MDNLDYESKKKRLKSTHLNETILSSNFKNGSKTSNEDYLSSNFKNGSKLSSNEDYLSSSSPIYLNGNKLIDKELNLSIPSLNNSINQSIVDQQSIRLSSKRPPSVYKLFKRLKIRKDILKGLKSMDLKDDHDKSIEQHKLIYNFLTEHQSYNIFIRSKPFHKLIAYLIHLLQLIDTDLDQIQILIIPCTLELSNQIYEVATKLKKYNDKIKIRMISSECLIDSKIKDHLLISTTGSVKHSLNSFKKLIDLNDLKFIVFEEFDLVNSSKDSSKFKNTESLEHILKNANPKCKHLYFSTCFEDNGLFSARDLTKDNLVILNLLKSRKNHFDKTLHFYISYSYRNKLDCLLNIIQNSNLKKIIIFVSGKYAPTSLYNLLSERGVRSIILTNELKNDLRLKAVNDFRDGKERILVLNYPLNVSIDFGEVNLIISYDPVTRGERYLYREFFQKYSYLDKYDKLSFSVSFIPSNLLEHVEQLESYFDIKMIEFKPLE